MTSEEITLIEVWITAENEGPNSQLHIPLQFCQHLIGVTHDRAATARACQPDTAPKMRLDPQAAGSSAKSILPSDSGTAGIE